MIKHMERVESLCTDVLKRTTQYTGASRSGHVYPSTLCRGIRAEWGNAAQSSIPQINNVKWVI